MTRIAARAAALLLVSCSCVQQMPQPSWTVQPQEAYLQVPYPPPPGRVEFAPRAPRDGAVWIDGEWRWEPFGKRWSWTYGRWVVPPAGAKFAPSNVARARDGTLFHAPGTWRDAQGNEVAPPPVLALGGASEEDVMRPVGIKEQTGRNLPPEPLRSAPRRRRPRSMAPPCEPAAGAPSSP